MNHDFPAVKILALLVATLLSSTLNAQMAMQRKTVPHQDMPASQSAPSNTTQNIGAIAVNTGECTLDYKGPPIITRVFPLTNAPWENNTILPISSTPNDPDSYKLSFMIEGCGLYSFDDNNREIIGFLSKNSDFSLTDDARETRALHSFNHALVSLNDLTLGVLKSAKAPIGPMRLVVQTPIGRTETDLIYYLAPIPKGASTAQISSPSSTQNIPEPQVSASASSSMQVPSSNAATSSAPAATEQVSSSNSSASMMASPFANACNSDNTPRINSVDGSKNGTQFIANGRQWHIAGCGFGDQEGSIELSTRSQQTVPLKVENWSDVEIIVSLPSSPPSVPDLDQVAIQINAESGAIIQSDFKHHYRVFTPMPEGWSK
jgi:hypothetical protein